MQRLSRRAFSTLALAATAASPARAAGPTITVNGSGGSLAQIIERIYEKPFTAETGIGVRATAPVSLPKLKAMVEARNMEWDLTEMGGTDMIEGVRNNWLQKIDWSIVDPTNSLPPIAREEYGMVTSTFSTVLAFRTDKFPGRKPQTWQDFWNVAAFPGPRALQDTPVHNLEFALIADGVDKDKLYPLDVDRAFKKLDEIKPRITTWWSTGAQQMQLLLDGEVVMNTVWNGRVTPAKKEGKPIDISWQGGALQLSYWAVPVGAKYPQEAMRYMRGRLDADRGAQFVKEIPYPGFIPGLMDKIDAATAATLPTAPANVAAQYATNLQWWSPRRAALIERWNRWLLT